LSEVEAGEGGIRRVKEVKREKEVKRAKEG
jgi:hypothetical protein